jgi:hypothetical protein
MQGPEEILRHYIFKQINAWDVVAWAIEMQAEIRPDHSAPLDFLSAYEPAGGTKRPDLDAIDALVKLSTRLDATSPLEYEMEYLATLLKRRELTPMQFCKRIQEIEAQVLDHRMRYPLWLGEAWDACDWCDESWTVENSPWLIDIAKKIAPQPPDTPRQD